MSDENLIQRRTAEADHPASMRGGRKLLLLGLALAGCLDFPDENIGEHYRCKTDDHCIAGYRCSSDLCTRIAQSGDTCVSHASSQCNEGHVYWFDSCGSREDLRQDCGTMPCDGTACQDPNCQPSPRASASCYNGDVYWYDSCGAREGVKETCTNGCQGAACTASTSTECSVALERTEVNSVRRTTVSAGGANYVDLYVRSTMPSTAELSSCSVTTSDPVVTMFQRYNANGCSECPSGTVYRAAKFGIVVSSSAQRGHAIGFAATCTAVVGGRTCNPGFNFSLSVE